MRRPQTLRSKAFGETRAEVRLAPSLPKLSCQGKERGIQFLQSSLKMWDALTIIGFCAKALSHPISTYINRWQGLQGHPCASLNVVFLFLLTHVIQDLAIPQASPELFDPIEA
ncbi:hypothetical protein Tco_0761341 [Tanacetum coccineum]